MVFLFCPIQEESHLHMRAICFTPTVWNVNLTPKDPCRNTQNHIWPNIWAAHGPLKLTRNITHYREDWRGPTGLAGITSALLWPVQGRVFCRAILETAQGADFISQMGSRSCYQEKGEGIPRNSWAFCPESLTWSLASMGLTSIHSSLLWLLLWALLCVKGEQSEWGKK